MVSARIVMRACRSQTALALLGALLLGAAGPVLCEDTCVEETPCSCKLADNRYIDISQAVKSSDNYITTTEDKNLTFYFSPCSDYFFNITAIRNQPVNSTCNRSTSLCMYNATDNLAVDLGTVKERKFVIGASIHLQFHNTTVFLSCVEDVSSVLASLGINNGRMVLDLLSPQSCLFYDHHGLSTGSKLLIMVCCGFAVYLIGGVLVLHFLRGARGKEVIPNVDFWCSLPGLVKDGFIFLLNGCNPITTTSAEAYDRI